MKKCNPLTQYKTPKNIPITDPDKEISFWLVKMSPDLIARIDECRKRKGHNKKVTVTYMAHVYLNLYENPGVPVRKA